MLNPTKLARFESYAQIRIQHRLAYRTNKLMLKRDVPVGMFTCSQAALQIATALSLEQLGVTYVKACNMWQVASSK